MIIFIYVSFNFSFNTFCTIEFISYFDAFLEIRNFSINCHRNWTIIIIDSWIWLILWSIFFIIKIFVSFFFFFVSITITIFISNWI